VTNEITKVTGKNRGRYAKVIRVGSGGTSTASSDRPSAFDGNPFGSTTAHPG
jgi:hypothetical protein